MSKKPNVPPKEKPQRPETFYFRFRRERLQALQGQENRAKIIQEEWKNVPVATKDAEHEKYKIESAKYREELKLWLSTHPEDKPSKREKSQTRDDDSDADKRKGDKSRGKPPVVTKATKGKEAEEEEEKVEKGKSRGKGNEKGKGKVEEKPKAEEKSKVEEKSKKNKK